MEEKRSSIVSKKNSLKFTAKNSAMIDKRLEQKNKLIQKLELILSKPCSQFGYTQDIIAGLEELSITQNDFFQICMSCLSKTARRKEESNLIFGYLYLMNDFVNMLTKNNDSHIFEDLRLIAQNLGYEKLPESHILMRLGEKGKKAYITLNGNIDILIKSSKEMKVLEKDYLYYIANLIRYREYGLVNIVMNDNFSIFPLEIIDDISQKENEKGKNKDNEAMSSDRKSVIEIEIGNYNEKENNTDKENLTNFRLSYQNQTLKDPKITRTYKASYLLSIFNIKLLDRKLDKALNHVSTENYIKRLNVCRDYTNVEIPLNKLGLETFYNLKIYSYIKIISRTTGSLFGEIALSDPQALRTATIITSTESHFGTLNKKSYNESLKSGAEKQQRQTLVFLTNFPVFNNLPSIVFFKRYFTYFSEKNPIKGTYIYNQGDKPNCFALLREGNYEVTAKINIQELTTLIINLLNKGNNDKYQTTLTNLLNNERELHYILKDNIKFRNLYNKRETLRISEIESPEFIGFNDYIDRKGNIAFNVECKSPKGQYYSLNYDFYKEMRSKEYSIRANEVKMRNLKIDFMIKRLITIRNSLIKSFFDYKMERNPVEKKLKEEYIIETFKRMNSKRSFDNKSIIFGKGLISLLHNRNSLSFNQKMKTERNKQNSPEKPILLLKSLTNRKQYTTSNKVKKIKKIIIQEKNLRLNTDSEKLLKVREQILLPPSCFSFKKKIKQLLQNKYSIYRESNYFSDNDNTSEIYNSNNDIKSLYNETTNNKTYINNTEFTNPNLNTELITQENKPPKIMMNDMVWENVKPKVKFPIFHQLSFTKSKTYYIPHSRNSTNYVSSFSQTSNNIASHNHLYNNSNNFHQGKFLRKEMNIIRENNDSNKVVDIYGYCTLKKQKYSFDRIKKLVKSNNRLQNMFGGPIKK